VYTQCPDCTTVFRITAEALRIARGQARCGVCAATFDALEQLSEEPFQAAPESMAATTVDTITVEELPGTEVIELSTPAEPAPVVATASILQFRTEYPADSGGNIEVSVEADSVEHWIETADPGAIAAALSADAAAADQEAQPVVPDLDPTDEFPILVIEEYEADAETDAGAMTEATEVAVDQTPAEQVPEAPPAASAAIEEPTTAPVAADELPPHIVIPEELRRGLAAEAEAAAAAARAFDLEPEAVPRPRRWPWAIAVVLLALLLAGQVVHSQRESLLRRPDVGPWLARGYALLGQPLAAPVDLEAFELRQWGATTDAAQPGRLVLRASIVNRAAHAQAYPLLRLTLQDRFGGVVGAREVDPADYLPAGQAARLLGPGQRADATISVVDPGRDAVGFEIDVCLLTATGLRCAGDPPPAAP